MMLEVEISSQPIELYKLLKIANMVSGGGEAKIVITEGYVFVNQKVEYQKRKKIFHDDTIEFNGELIHVICHQPIEVLSNPPQSKLKKTKQHNETSAKEIPGGRRRISF